MIEFDVVETPAGPCAVAVREGKIVRLRLGREIGIEARRRRLPQVRRWIMEWFAGRAPRVSLEIQASPFDRRVYDIVRRIPSGRTRTYGEVARAAGRPGAARAVGNALARNRVCLFIPCHRVVGTAGLGGFSAPGGLATKRLLLGLEGAKVG